MLPLLLFTMARALVSLTFSDVLRLHSSRLAVRTSRRLASSYRGLFAASRVLVLLLLPRVAAAAEPFITSEVTVNSSCYPSEVSWSLAERHTAFLRAAIARHIARYGALLLVATLHAVGDRPRETILQRQICSGLSPDMHDCPILNVAGPIDGDLLVRESANYSWFGSKHDAMNALLELLQNDENVSQLLSSLGQHRQRALQVVIVDSDTAWGSVERSPLSFLRTFRLKLAKARRLAAVRARTVLIGAELVPWECNTVCGKIPQVPSWARAACPQRLASAGKPPIWLNAGMYAGARRPHGRSPQCPHVCGQHEGPHTGGAPRHGAGASAPRELGPAAAGHPKDPRHVRRPRVGVSILEIPPKTDCA